MKKFVSINFFQKELTLTNYCLLNMPLVSILRDCFFILMVSYFFDKKFSNLWIFLENFEVFD
jgi:hypothetical protein